MSYKANQVREAILRTLGARDARAEEIRHRLRRLIAVDRRLGRRPRAPRALQRHYAFYDRESSGTGIDIWFTDYEAFALFAAVLLLEHGLPQMTVVKLLRQVREDFQEAHADLLRRNPNEIFDDKSIRAQARPGMIAFETTVPVILVFAKLDRIKI